MRVSVVIPTYNAEPFLAATVESVRAQTVRDWELVIVDDGSTDGTRAVAEAFAARDPRIRCVHQSNGGVAAARNRGLAETSADAACIALLDHDDLWAPDALEALLTALDADPRAVAAHGVAYAVDGGGQRIPDSGLELGARERRAIVGTTTRRVRLDEPTTFASMALFSILTTPGQALIRRSALMAAGPLDPETVPADDWDLWLRLTARGDIAFVDREVLGFRTHGANQSGDHARMWAATLCVRRKHLEGDTLTPEQKRLVAVGHQLACRETARNRMHWAQSCLADGQLLAAAKQVRHAAISLARTRKSL